MWVPHVSLLRHGFTLLHDAHGAGSQSFAYDQLNRVQSAQAGTSWGDTYVYDSWGNLLQKNPISGVGAAENLVIAVNPTNQVVGLAYDAAGNVTSDNLNPGVWVFPCFQLSRADPLTLGGADTRARRCWKSNRIHRSSTYLIHLTRAAPSKKNICEKSQQICMSSPLLG